MTNVNQKNFDITEAAEEMFTLLKDNSQQFEEGDTVVSEEGLEKLSSFFGTISRDDRAEVFLNFLANMHDGGYSYDITQFMGEAV